MNQHRRLGTWLLAKQLVRYVYDFTDALPPAEKYVTVPQLRRAAWSVQNNIAEGNAKLGKRERRRFLDCSLGSLAEIDSMVVTLRELYELDNRWLETFEQLRPKLTAGIFGMLRRER